MVVFGWISNDDLKLNSIINDPMSLNALNVVAIHYLKLAL